MSFLFNRHKGRGIPHNATFRLTQEGREKLQNFDGSGQMRILMSLETRGTSDIDEIAEASGQSRGQVERFIRPLVAGQYIQYVSASMGAEEG